MKTAIKSPRAWKAASKLAGIKPQFVWLVWCHDVWYTMDGGIVPTLVSVHRSRAGAMALKKAMSKAKKKGVTYSITKEVLCG